MPHLPTLITDLAVILAVASIVTLLFQKIRQPVVLGYLVAGMIVGPHMPPYSLVQNYENVQVLSELGVIFLMFSLGLEFSFHKLKRVGFSASVTGCVEVIGMLLLGWGIGELLGWSFYDSIFLGAALSISSTTIIIKALAELKLKHKQFAQLIFGVLIVEDLLAILILVAISTLVTTHNIVSLGMVWVVIKLIVVVGGWFLLGYFLVPSLFRNIAPYASEETLTIVSVALCLLLVCTAVYFDYSIALGAFIMGSIIAETPMVHQLEKLVHPIRDLFAAVFFVAVGMLIDPKIIWHNLWIVLLLCFVTIFGKIIITSLSALLTGRNVKTSLRIGLGMGQIGEFSFIIASVGLALNVISARIYPLVVAVSVVTTFTTPYLIRYSIGWTRVIEKRLPQRWHLVLEHYSLWLDKLGSSHKLKAAYRKAIIQWIINTVIVAVIFSVSDAHLLPFLEKIIAIAAIAKIVGWVVAILVALPFVWGMVGAFRHAETKEAISKVMLYVSWPVAALEIIILSIIYFDNWAITAVFVVLAVLLFVLLYKKLDQAYHWLEKNLMQNIHAPHTRQAKRYDELAPWDTHLVEIDVGRHSPLLEKNLHDQHIRQRFGINIVAIYRDCHAILSPRGGQKIEPFDKLIVLGNDAQIEEFKNQLIIEAPPEQYVDLLENFALRLVAIEAGDPMIGKSIRDSGIRERTNGLVTGLERHNRRVLNPDSTVVLEVGDVLFVVGEVDKIKNA